MTAGGFVSCTESRHWRVSRQPTYEAVPAVIAPAGLSEKGTVRLYMANGLDGWRVCQSVLGAQKNCRSARRLGQRHVGEVNQAMGYNKGRLPQKSRGHGLPTLTSTKQKDGNIHVFLMDGYGHRAFQESC